MRTFVSNDINNINIKGKKDSDLRLKAFYHVLSLVAIYWKFPTVKHTLVSLFGTIFTDLSDIFVKYGPVCKNTGHQNKLDVLLYFVFTLPKLKSFKI